MTGHGGWPLTVFLTPDGSAVLRRHVLPPGVPRRDAELADGTRRPSPTRGRKPRARQVQPDRPASSSQATERQRRRRAVARADRGRLLVRGDHRGAAVGATTRRYGGFGGAPKFPHASASSCCLPVGERETARRHARGDGARRDLRPDRRRLRPLRGRRDLDGSRTSRRCSTTTRCSRAPICTDGRSRARSDCAEVCCETLDWTLREMRGPEGGFYSALDADSEGVEGKFYVWTVAELRDALGDRWPTRPIAYFGATERGNFEAGHNVLEGRGPVPDSLPEIRCRGCSRPARGASARASTTSACPVGTP